MVAVSASTATQTPPVVPPTSSPPPATSSDSPSAANAGPVDRVTLSAEAQQILDGKAPPTDSAAATSSGSAQDQITAAVSALNDTSGKTSLDDQLKAYALISGLVAKGQVLMDNRLPPANPPPGGMIKSSDAQALFASAFSQHLEQVVSQVDTPRDPGAADNGYDLANAIDKGLSAFNALSADDQQIYVAAKNTYNSLNAPGSAPLSVDDYRANQQAQADVDRAVQAAQDNPAYAGQIATDSNTGKALDFKDRAGALASAAQAAGDAATAGLARLAGQASDSPVFTQAAQAYFAKNGPAPTSHADTGQTFAQSAASRPPAGYAPPDVKSLMDALAKVDDTSGSVMAADQVAAKTLLDNYAAAGGGGIVGASVVMNAQASPFTGHVAQTKNLVELDIVPGKNPYSQMLDNLNRLSQEDQQVYYGATRTDASGKVVFKSLDSEKDNLSTRADVLKIYQMVTKAYGVDDLSQLTTAAAKNNAALQKLQTIFHSDQGNDDWTALAKDFLAHTTAADLGLAPPDANGDPDMAKALETLKEVAANQKAFVLAIKAGKVDQWHAVEEAKKVKDKDAADDLMKQAVAPAA